MTENKIKHLEFLQNVITRMNTNSFQIKTFTVTIMSALLAVFVSNKNAFFILVAIFSVLIFWFLDSYYLQQERKFRSVYNNVTGLKWDIKIRDFEMPIHKFKGGSFNYWNAFFSVTILLFYGSILLLLSMLFMVLKFELLKSLL